MTFEDALALPAGIALDAIIYDRVMNDDPGVVRMVGIHIPYSTKMSAAWEVVEKIAGGSRKVVLDTGFGGAASCDIENDDGSTAAYEVSGSMPLAICRAALRAAALLATSSSPETSSGSPASPTSQPVPDAGAEQPERSPQAAE
jgi:hypothetical protein